MGRRFDPDRAHHYAFLVSSAVPLEVGQKYILLTLIVVSLSITPDLSSDPINIVKLSALVVGLSLSLPIFVSIYLKGGVKFDSFLIAILGAICSLNVVSFFQSDQPKLDQFWGAWGRSSGLLYYTLLLVLFLMGYALSRSSKPQKLLDGLLLLNVPFSLYATLQVFDLDPIPWSRKEVFATLGNTNFSSAMFAFLALQLVARLLYRAEKNSVRLLIGTLLVLDLFLMFKTLSVQGPLLFGIGIIIVFLIKIWHSGHLKTLALSAAISLISGGFVIMGILKRGPLSGIIYQETLAFRVDYWRAGIRMIEASPLTGFGFDSYGDYYRQYRDLDAVLRTGPERTSNTAHNIFIDIGVNAGLLTLLLTLLLFLRPLFLGTRSIIRKQMNQEFQVFIYVFIFVYFLQSLISINQVGVGVWGWFFLGALSGITIDKLAKSARREELINLSGKNANSYVQRESKAKKNVNSNSHLPASQVLITFVIALISIPMALIPLVTDNRVLNVIRSLNAPTSESPTSLPLGGALTTGQAELILNGLATLGDKRTTAYAESILESNPRNIYAWRILEDLGESEEIRSRASEMLKALDPLNPNHK